MLNVKIKNFQSIGNISFDIDGFTVIVGKNNLGKSAIVRAIDASLTNRTGSEFVRWGKTKAEVALKKDALDIQWSKGDTATYKVNGQSFSKLNRTIPQPITDAGIKKIEIGDQKLNPLIAHQFEELFLLDKPGSVITDVLSVIYNLNVLSDANDLCLKDIKSKKSLLKIRESDQVDIKEKLDKYKDLDSIKKEMQAIQELDRKTKNLSDEINRIDGYVTEIKEISEEIIRLQKMSQIVIPSPEVTEKSLTEYLWFSKAIDTLKELLIRTRSLEAASKAVVPEYSGIQGLIDQHLEITQYNDSLETVKKNFNELAGALNALEPIEKLSLSLPTVEEKIKECTQFKSLSDDFINSAKIAKDLKSDLEKNTEELNKAQEEYSQFKTCPLCRKPL